MKKIAFITLVIITQTFLLKAQEKATRPVSSKIGISFSSFGDNDVFRFNELDGAASYDSDKFFTIGVNYIYGLNKWLEIETALEYSKQYVIVNPNLPSDSDNSPWNADFSLINIPVALRVNFLKYFFITGGAIIDIDASINSPIDNQTGLGALLGLGVKYDFKSGISAFINPYTKIHTLLPTIDIDNHQRIWENGFRFGVTYDLNCNK